MTVGRHLSLAATLLVTIMCTGLPGLAQGAEEPPTVTLALKDASLPQALALLFRDSGSQFQIEGGLGGSVTADLSDVPWDQALRLVLDSQGLTSKVQDNVYRISRKQVNPLHHPAPPPPSAPYGRADKRPIESAAPAGGGQGKLELIQVQHADPAMLAAVFGGISVGYSYGGYGGGYGSSGPYGGSGGYGATGGGYGGLGAGFAGLGGFGGQGWNRPTSTPSRPSAPRPTAQPRRSGGGRSSSGGCGPSRRPT